MDTVAAVDSEENGAHGEPLALLRMSRPITWSQRFRNVGRSRAGESTWGRRTSSLRVDSGESRLWVERGSRAGGLTGEVALAGLEGESRWWVA